MVYSYDDDDDCSDDDDDCSYDDDDCSDDGDKRLEIVEAELPKCLFAPALDYPLGR